MKHIIYSACFALFLISCNSSGEGENTKTDSATLAKAAAPQPFQDNCPTPDDCAQMGANCHANAGECLNASCYDDIIACHKLNDSVFMSYRIAFNVDTPDGREYAITDLAPDYGQSDADFKCQFKLQFNGNPADVSNNDIGVLRVEDKRDSIIESKYSAIYFRALQKAGYTTFKFYKGVKPLPNGQFCRDIVFSTVKGGTEEKYYGDMAGLYP